MPAMMRQRPLISGLFYFMEEIFKDVPGYEGLYQVSNLGRVKSLSRLIKNRYTFFISKEKFLKSEISSGYVVFYLSKETITKHEKQW